MSTRLCTIATAVATGVLGVAAVIAIATASAGDDGSLSTTRPSIPLSYCGYTDQEHCDY